MKESPKAALKSEKGCLMSKAGAKLPLELYLHIPFCVQKCLYCDFLSFTSSAESRELYTEKLIEEITVMGAACGDYEVVSIFLGGGTPSILEAEQTCRIMEAVMKYFCVAPGAEITSEANPGTVDRKKLMAYKACKINRLSLGLQSAVEKELKELGRIHTLKEFLEGFQEARAVGFENINVDLMSALPGQTMESYKKSLEVVTRLSPEHISAYSLIIEEGTPFYGRVNSLALPDEETEREMYHFTKRFLKAEGYERYEISNYAKAGWECLHNTGYWRGTQYLGLGLNSSSYMAGRRFANEGDLKTYLSFKKEDFLKGAHHRDMELLTLQAQMEEFMFLGLRLVAGISVKEFEGRFGSSIQSVYGEKLEKYVSEGLMEQVLDPGEKGRKAQDNLYIRLTDYGTDVSNYVLSGFLL